MSIGMIFHFEDNIASIQSGRDVDMRMWSNIANSFNLDEFFCVDCTEAGIRHEEDGYKQYKSLKEAQEDNPKYTWVYLCPEKSVPEGKDFDYLENFEHPQDNVCYVFGRDSCGFSNETNDILDGKYVCLNIGPSQMWAHVVSAIVLHDRKSKVV